MVWFYTPLWLTMYFLGFPLNSLTQSCLVPYLLFFLVRYLLFFPVCYLIPAVPSSMIIIPGEAVAINQNKEESDIVPNDQIMWQEIAHLYLQ